MPALPEPLPDRLAPVVPIETPTGREAAARLLGEQLRYWREERRLTQGDVADAIRASVSKISRLERGQSPAKTRDVMDLGRFMRLSSQEMRLIERLLQQTQDCEWYQHFSDVTPSYLKRLISLEGSAETITSYEHQVVPGLLQTSDYARALVRTVKPWIDETELDRTVALRRRRQLILDRPTPRVTALIDQSVLLRPRGGAAVMREQLVHLLNAGETRRVNVRIVEFDQGATASPPYAITHLAFGQGGPSEVVYVEHINGADYVTHAKALQEYKHALDQLRHAAADRARSKELIGEAIRRYS
ncbi:helix-turn-helix domain-containing protein [Streptomyces sp. NBC_01768]|uniref:helix-turn-helix domain-containing protein n=1 Tax=Streptomyces sp. NBC_01768 TaxID=2975938 RepID=UPI002DDBD46F|nr:helix-turn-helix transcriptional regulator [Streptomyces sp. NBC_01768]WSC32131.1 helix-turn-helix transcriptional regulator [Streptomyces sp. NBC_01768]